jgi:CRP/FNR family transcriptional regulator, cyclic AMP receptor protein
MRETPVSARPVAAPLPDHSGCQALFGRIRGRLCQQLAVGPARRLDVGERLYSMGQPATALYLVRRGLLKTSIVSSAGQERTLRLYPAGEILGELCLCTGERREEAVALESSEVVEIPASALLRRLREDPEAAMDLATALCEHLAQAQEGFRNLSFASVTERVARALLELADRLGSSEAGCTRIGYYITQEELARIVGARREVVSGLLNRFRDEGLISYTRRGLIRIDRGALQSYVESIAET